MRKNETFNSSDTIVLILKSMNPWEAKLEALKIPAHEESLPLPRYEIDLVYPVKNYKNNNPIHFSATWFNGKIRIYAIHAASVWGEAHCFKHNLTDYLAGGWMGRYSLPFPTMSKVKLQTPFMRDLFPEYQNPLWMTAIAGTTFSILMTGVGLPDISWISPTRRLNQAVT